MKKIYFTILLLMLCTASVFSSQLDSNASIKEYKLIEPVKKDSSNIISGIINLPSFR